MLPSEIQKSFVNTLYGWIVQCLLFTSKFQWHRGLHTERYPRHTKAAWLRSFFLPILSFQKLNTVLIPFHCTHSRSFSFCTNSMIMLSFFFFSLAFFLFLPATSHFNHPNILFLFIFNAKLPSFDFSTCFRRMDREFSRVMWARFFFFVSSVERESSVKSFLFARTFVRCAGGCCWKQNTQIWA